ncbi:cysteine-rich CWC family protein [Acidovorax sp. FG27]|uniref:cysteine-rich CWC family protein n=1 Tax=Acidovorax sp. FG27 TaxID=3133652 RepID=UPI0030E9CD31
MTATRPPTDPSRCPLCGQANRCAIEAGQPAADCWCMAASVAPQALSAVPPDQIGRACLCPACAAGTEAPDALPPSPAPI